MRSYWDGGSKTTYIVLRLQDKKCLKVPNGHPVFDNLSGVDDWMIPEGFIVVSHCIFCGKDMGLTIHTPSTTQFLPSGDKIELTKVQNMVLSWIVGLTSAGRKDEISRNYFPKKLYDIICKELEELELVKINKAGSVSKTLKAQNMYTLASQNNEGYSWWSKFYNWRTRKFEGEGREILKQYGLIK